MNMPHIVENQQKIHKIDIRSYQTAQCEEIIAPTMNTNGKLGLYDAENKRN